MDEKSVEICRKFVPGFFAIIAVVLAAIHCPGQMSVDSISALYEGATHSAVGWGPTFFSAFLAWLGGNVVGTSLFIVINCCVTYGCFVALLNRRAGQRVPGWQTLIALILALNPLFMFYVGIVWKDVMLTTAAMCASTTLFFAADRSGSSRYINLGAAALAISCMPLIRQQGILLALPFATLTAYLIIRKSGYRLLAQIVVFALSISAIFGATLVLEGASARTVRPAPSSPVSVGFLTIRAYDIAGMVKYAPPGDMSNWANASEDVRERIRKMYSPERIDTFWHDPDVRAYFNSLSAKESLSIWMSGLRHSPISYIKHRIKAFSSLLGLGDINGCVPAYWGVAGLPDELAALSLQEQMDARARVIGRTSLELHDTPIFRNWFYALILLVATGLAYFRLDNEQRKVGCVIALSAWLYLFSFVPTTIACDFRYLYPVAGLVTILCMAIFLHVPVWGRIVKAGAPKAPER
ncbi:hypothetical protein [Dyella sp.]|uniref:hypothetical protein n=1 Tax=Dyella sp. TaxID=1869338 RepID=UPI003F7F9D7B